jgi:hypothetical protein
MMMNKYASMAALMNLRSPAMARQAALFAAASSSHRGLVQQPSRGFRQVKNLHEIVWTA